MTGDATTMEPAEFWEDRYAGSDAVWSGRVNATMADVVAGFTPGRALDLGCGEGGDVLWLAERGWDALGVDISTTAVARASGAARERGLDRARFEAGDLATWSTGQAFDLVAASFLQSPVELPRAHVLRSASGWVAPGGHLLLITHAAPPPWASPEHMGHHIFLSPQEEVEQLALDPTEWTVLTTEVRRRDVTDPDGLPAQLDDAVVLAQRAGGAQLRLSNP